MHVDAHSRVRNFRATDHPAIKGEDVNLDVSDGRVDNSAGVLSVASVDDCQHRFLGLHRRFVRLSESGPQSAL